METGNTHWINPDANATYITGFTALHGRFGAPYYQEYRYSTFSNLGYNSAWWSATEYSNNVGYAAFLYSYSPELYVFREGNIDGNSVRCLKD